ncbi:hypothetical protein ACLB2K_034286 [Fragaria x ananassa]
MASGFYVQPCEVYGDNKCDEVVGLDLNLSSMSCLPFSSLSTLENSSAVWEIPFIDETRNLKRVKLENSADESIVSTNYSLYSGSGSMYTGGFNSLSRIQIRDHISAYTRRYMAAEAMEEAASTMLGGEPEEEGSGDGMKLVQKLISCAEAVACRDKTHASALLYELRTNAQVFGTSFQRVASCFIQALSDRLALVQPLGAVGVTTKIIGVSSEKDEALHLVYDICPHIRFSHFVANTSILEAFEGESSVHVIDLGMTLGLLHGYQWRNLIDSLASRTGRLPRLRITGVGNSCERLEAIGNELKLYAQNIELEFEFLALESNLENLKAEDFSLIDGEVLVINSILQLHCLVKESRGALNSDSSHNGPFFLGRFMEALHNYSAIFDSLDAMLPKYDTRRAKVEQFYFGEEIKNIVSCEGPARVERHERIDQWRRRMRRAGFQPAPLKTITQATKWLEKNASEGYTIVEDKGCFVLGWKSKPIIAASCWRCS